MSPKEKAWFLLENERQTGPFTYAQLVQRYAKREIHGNSLCFPYSFLGFLGFGESSWKTLRHYFLEFDRIASDNNVPPKHNKDAGSTNGPQATTSFECVNCKVELRVSLLPGSCRCPKCKTAYIIREVHKAPQTLLIIPQVSLTSDPHSQESPTANQINTAVESTPTALQSETPSPGQRALSPTFKAAKWGGLIGMMSVFRTETELSFAERIPMALVFSLVLSFLFFVVAYLVAAIMGKTNK
jgi:hypothetical protein